MFGLTWKRPNNIPYPNVWHEFKVKSKTEEIIHVKIEDVTPDRFDEFSDFITTYFENHEPITRALITIFGDQSQILSDRLKRIILEQNICLIATTNYGSEDNKSKSRMIGVQNVFVETKNDTFIEVSQQDSYILLMNIIEHIKKDIDPFKLLNCDEYMEGFGMCVDPEFYGLGIGSQLQRTAFITMGKVLNMAGSCTLFTSIYAQRIAANNGFETINEVQYEDFEDENGKVIFPVVTESKSAKLMLLKLK